VRACRIPEDDRGRSKQKDDKTPVEEGQGRSRGADKREPETTEVKTMTAAAEWKSGEIEPVHLLAIGFEPEAKFEGRILNELAKLDRKEMIRILDHVFVQKDAETGNPLAPDYQGEELGTIVGAQPGFEFVEGEEQAAGSTEEEKDDR
jgi:hypothetical protein